MPKGNPEVDRAKEKAKMRREQGSSAMPAKANCHREVVKGTFIVSLGWKTLLLY